MNPGAAPRPDSEVGFLPVRRTVLLATGALRRAVIAPEIERYLSLGHVDLLYADQVEALMVRTKRGLDVFRSRIEHALAVAARSRKRAGLILGTTWAVYTTVLIADASGVLTGPQGAAPGFEAGAWRWPVRALGLAALAGFFIVLVGYLRLLKDTRRLDETLEGLEAPATALASLRTQQEVAALAESLLAKARDLGALITQEDEDLWPGGKTTASSES